MTQQRFTIDFDKADAVRAREAAALLQKAGYIDFEILLNQLAAAIESGNSVKFTITTRGDKSLL